MRRLSRTRGGLSTLHDLGPGKKLRGERWKSDRKKAQLKVMTFARLFRWYGMAVLLAIAGCAGVRDLVSRSFERPTLTFQSASLEGLDLEGVTVSLHYRVDNPNGVGLQLARLGYALDVEGRRALAGELPAGVQIPARGSAPLVVPVRLRYRDLSEVLEILAARDQVGYRVSGHAGIDTPIGIVDLAFEHQGWAPVPRPPSFAVESARVTSASATQVGLALRLRVHNANGFPLPVGRLQCAVAVSGTPVASADALPLAGVPPEGSAVFELPLNIQIFGAARAAALALSGEPLEIAVTGAAGYGSVRVPLEVRGTVSPRR
jgi:LEA14-like dessication related protein